MTTTTKCDCGKRALKQSSKCKACYKIARDKKEAEWLALVQQTNQLLSKTTVIQDTAFGPYIVDSVYYNALGAHLDTHPAQSRRDDFTRRTFMVHFGVIESIRDKALQAAL